MLLLKRKPHVGVIAIGNALGNSIVAKAQSLEQIRSNAAAAQRGLSGAVQTTLDDNFNEQVNHNAAQIGANLFADSARQFDNSAEQRLLDADAFNQTYLDKRTGAIDGYLGMSRKTQQSIAGLTQRGLAGQQLNQAQSAIASAYYGRKAIDVRLENPVYKGSQSLLSSEQNQRAKNLINDDHWLSGVNAKQQELELLTQKLYATVYDKPDLLQDKPALLKDSHAVKDFNRDMAEVGMLKGSLSMGYNSGVDFVYGNLHSMTPIGAPANALPSHPNFRTLTWGFGLASDAKGQPVWSTKPWRQSVDMALDTSFLRIGNGVLTYAGPIVGTAGIAEMIYHDATNPAFNPTSWDYFSEGSKNVVDWSIAYVGSTNPVGAAVSLAYTAADYSLQDYQYRPTRPLDGNYQLRSSWHGFGYSISDSYLNNIEANQRILGPNWKMHGKY